MKLDAPTSPSALGMIRAFVCAFFLANVLLTSFQALGRLPSTLLRPTGLMQLLPWTLYDSLLTPPGMLGFKILLVLSLTLGATGMFTTWTTKISALLVLFYEGLLRSYGHFNHDEMPALYILLVLAFSPCGDAFSLDSRLRERGTRAHAFIYSYPIILMRALVAWSYFSSALIKLRVAGIGYLSPDNLPSLAIIHSLDNLHDTQFRLAFALPAWRELTPLAVALIWLWEFAFPIVIWSKRARVFILASGVLFHFMTLIFMNIFFPYHLAMYLVFIDWDYVRNRTRSIPANKKRRSANHPSMSQGRDEEN